MLEIQLNHLRHEAKALLDLARTEQIGISEAEALFHVVEQPDSLSRWHDLYWAIHFSQLAIVQQLDPLREKIVSGVGSLIQKITDRTQAQVKDLDSASIERIQAILTIVAVRARWNQGISNAPVEDIEADWAFARMTALRIVTMVWHQRATQFLELLPKIKELDPDTYTYIIRKRPDTFYMVHEGIERSLAYICSIVLSEDAKSAYLNHNHINAFKQWATAFGLFEASRNVSEDVDYSKPDRNSFDAIHSHFMYQKIASSFEKLKDGRDGDWSNLYDLTQLLLDASWIYEESPEPELLNSNGMASTWWDYWHIQEGWLQGRMTPDQLRDIQRKQNDEDAEQRLLLYFFDDKTWHQLSDRAKQALISADDALYRLSKGRPGGIIDQIQTAIEDFLIRAVWEPTKIWSSESIPLDDLNRLSESSDRSYVKGIIDSVDASDSPGLVDLRRILSHRGLKYILPDLSENDCRFLRQELAPELEKLFNVRNPDRHELDRAADRDQALRTYSRWIGGRQEGLLPKLISVFKTRDA